MLSRVLARSSSSTSAPAAAASMASLFKLKAIETIVLVPDHLTKEVIMAGTGGTPASGNTVTAHYTGKLKNGSDFDSSRTRGKPFQFKIGIGQVIKSVRGRRRRGSSGSSSSSRTTSGPRRRARLLPFAHACARVPSAPLFRPPRRGWDVGMATMKVGERAVFTISSDYGYGDDGYEPVIPGGATLFFDVEMLKFTK